MGGVICGAMTGLVHVSSQALCSGLRAGVPPGTAVGTRGLRPPAVPSASNPSEDRNSLYSGLFCWDES